MLAADILRFIEENDVKFVKLNFCDPFGNQKNISIIASEFKDAVKNGVSFDASSVSGFSNIIQSDLLLVPDINTMSILPWRPHSGRVIRFYCDIKNTDGSDFICDGRAILKNAIDKLSKLGYTAKIGTECEFYLFQQDEEGNPTYKPLDKASYLDIAPLDKGENIRREICLALEDMGLVAETSHHERGPGQNEIDFNYADTMESADNFLSFKALVKAISNRNGLYASFMPRPIKEESGNGLHINIYLYKDGKNIFTVKGEQYSEAAKSFIAGVLAKIKEITLFLNNNMNSYDRLGKDKAPKYVSWSHQNRAQLIRIPYAKSDKMRMEVRSADSTLNPYIAFALLLEAGIYGIENKLKLNAADNRDTYEDNDGLEKLPETLMEAVQFASENEFVKEILSEKLVDIYASAKKSEYQAYMDSTNKKEFYYNQYFLYL